ncbi:C40 family peptidase [Hymenobacter sp.]|uniref:C40 family peptidase n=1 Tax=Hymenobacter sp. TaxID=1898978 RepID=UPI00286BD4D2|nr:C40 family peptidase [Hymenobacter sp.]
MRFVWLVFIGLVVAMALVLPGLNRPTALSVVERSPAITAGPTRPVAAVRTMPTRAAPAQRGPAGRADSVVAFGLAQRGTPYQYAGTSPLTGFDCSGFILFTFARFRVAVPHSTALLIAVGQPVARAEAQPGDIVVFTGTAATSTAPGHAGIVVSARGEVPLRFVHSSSARRESGVKVSQVEGTDYERRFLQVRRVL